jgi:hypothetical protein
MKKITSLIIAIIVFSMSYSQTILPKDLKINKSYVESYFKAQTVSENALATPILRGTGVDNAVLFNEWSEMLPMIMPDLVPNGWLMQTGNVEAQQSTDAFVGDYAMYLESGDIVIDGEGNTELMGGMGLIGAVSVNWVTFSVDVTQGEAYTERPSNMTFAIKGNLLEQDSAVVGILLTKNTEIVGGTIVALGQADISTDEFTQFSFEVEYENTETPDTIVILSSSAGVGLFEGMNMGTITYGSYVIVDNIVLGFTNPVDFRIEDGEGIEISDALITVFDQGTTDIVDEVYSDELGAALLNLEDGDYDFIVTKEGYIDGTGTFTAETQDETIVVVLDLHDGPQILERTPEINETMVALDAEVSVTFTEDVFEIDFDGITILDEEDVAVENIVVSIDGAVLTIAHDDFDYNVTYTVVIPMGTIEDGDSNPLAFDISWNFTTINPIGIIHGVDDIEVYFNTTEVDVIAALPATTTIEDIPGEIYTVDLAWTIDAYDQITPGDYNATGTFELPEGVHQTDPETTLEVYAIVTVMEAPIIVDIDVNEEVEDIEVAYETTEAEAIDLLVAEITISDSDGFEHVVILDWAIDAYDGETPGAYNAIGTFTLPFGVDQTDPLTDLEVYAVVTVMDPALITLIDVNEDVEDVEVPYMTAEATAIDALVSQITIEDSYGVPYNVSLNWTIDAYDEETPGAYNATGTFELPAGVYQTDPETTLEVYAVVTVMDPALIDVIDVNEDVIDIEVEYMTTEAAAIEALVAQITIEDSYGVQYNVDLDWTIDNYDGESAGVYNATGTFELPAGVYQTDPETALEVSATVTVIDPITIAEIDVDNEVEDVTVDFGTIEADAIDQLVAQIKIKDSEDNEHIVSLTWTIAAYNGNQAGVYVATGTFELPAGVYQTNPATDLEVTANVTVLESSVEGINVGNISVFPNPSTGIVNISNVKGSDIEVINLSGQLIQSILNTDNELTIDLTKQSNGTYFIRIDGVSYKINLTK